MSIFYRLFSRRRRSPAFYKLKRCLSSGHFYKKIQQAYYLFCIPHSLDNVQLLKESIVDSDALETLRRNSDYDMSRDSLEIYYVKCVDGLHYFVLMLDPQDIEKKERIIEIIPSQQPLDLIGKPVI